MSSELWRSKLHRPASGELWWEALQDMSLELSRFFTLKPALTSFPYLFYFIDSSSLIIIFHCLSVSVPSKTRRYWSVSAGVTSGHARLIGLLNVTWCFCLSSTCRSEDQWEQGVVTSGGKKQKYPSILSALHGQDAIKREAHKLLYLIWLSPLLTKTNLDFWSTC